MSENRKIPNPLGFRLPETPRASKEEEEFAEAFSVAMSDANESGETRVRKSELAVPFPSDGKRTVWFVGAPADSVPEKALLLGTHFDQETDAALLSSMLSGSGIRTVRTDARTLSEILGTPNGKKALETGTFRFRSLPPANPDGYFKAFEKLGIRHPNSDGIDGRVMDDLFFQEQALVRCGATVPRTAWISVAEYFRVWDSEERLSETVGKRLSEAGIGKGARVFMRLWRGSLKAFHPSDIAGNQFVRALANVPKFLMASAMGRLRKATAWFLENKSVAETPEARAVAESVKSELEAVARVASSKEWASVFSEVSKAVSEWASASAAMMKSWTVSDWIFPAEPSLVAKKLSDASMAAVSSGLLTESWFAFREVVDTGVRGVGGKFSVPFSRDYRGIVIGGMLVSITTWTPYSDVIEGLRTGEFDLSEVAVSKTVVGKASDVAGKFSSLTGFRDFTLDFLVGPNGTPVFHEVNRLEFSHMSHPAARLVVAYADFCRIVGEKPSSVRYASMETPFREKKAFMDAFYGNRMKFLRSVAEREPKMSRLADATAKAASDEFESFGYPPVWSAFWEHLPLRK